MAASDNLHRAQFGPYMLKHDEDPDAHYIDATDGAGSTVGSLMWGKPSSWPSDDGDFDPPGAIHMAHVDPDHRRKGLATAMLRFGGNFDPPPAHSGILSEDGAAWAQGGS